MRAQHGHRTLDLVRVPDVVVIGERGELRVASRLAQQGEVAAHHADVGGRIDPDPTREPARVLREDGRRLVARSVVADPHLQRGVRLREHAVEQRPDEARTVVRREQHAHETGPHAATTSAADSARRARHAKLWQKSWFGASRSPTAAARLRAAYSGAPARPRMPYARKLST